MGLTSSSPSLYPPTAFPILVTRFCLLHRFDFYFRFLSALRPSTLFLACLSLLSGFFPHYWSHSLLSSLLRCPSLVRWLLLVPFYFLAFDSCLFTQHLALLNDDYSLLFDSDLLTEPLFFQTTWGSRDGADDYDAERMKKRTDTDRMKRPYYPSYITQ